MILKPSNINLEQRPLNPSRLTSPTVSRWNCTETTSLKSRTVELCPWRGRMFWRRGCGSSLSQRKGWTMVVWPESGSSSYLRRCLIPTTVCLNTLPRKSLLVLGSVALDDWERIKHMTHLTAANNTDNLKWYYVYLAFLHLWQKA